jgi:hypothetical protein
VEVFNYKHWRDGAWHVAPFKATREAIRDFEGVLIEGTGTRVCRHALDAYERVRP